jgi:Secretion system C-terminal sorting domain
VKDVKGQMIILEEGKTIKGINHHEIDLSGYAKGMYLITLQTGGFSKQEKVILE